MVQDGDRGSVEPKSEPPAAGNPSRQVGIDVRSRDAFELLKLGEAIVTLQADLRNLRLEKEDLRFDRNRYQASAAQYQSKLTSALAELDQARVYRDEAGRTRREVVILAQEFEDRLSHERNEITALRADLKAEYDHRLRDEIRSLSREIGNQLERERSLVAESRRENEALQREIAELRAQHEKVLENQLAMLRAELKVESDLRVRREIVMLARECATKPGDRSDAIDQEPARKFGAGPRERWKLR